MRILAIETSCDETSFAVVEVTQTSKTAIPDVRVIKNIVSSQVELHAQFGGVVPNLAKREHLKNLPLLWEEIQRVPIVRKKEIDLLVVTVGPGLEPALWTGILFAQEIHKTYFEGNIPLVGVNHMEGHLYSFLLGKLRVRAEKDIFPAVSLVVSGGHTILGVMKSLTQFKKLGETLDDAVGESFDKVARLLNLPYPGGPQLELLARTGDPYAMPFPSPMMHQKNYNFSYSGLKTSVLYYLKSLGSSARDFSLSDADKKTLTSIESVANVKADIAASFQRAAFDVLVHKTMRAVDEYGARSVFVGGGVAANKRLSVLLKKRCTERNSPYAVYVPPFSYCQDNAAMIALAGYMTHMKKKTYPMEADGMLSL